jgi:hypothetical protein
MGRLKTHAEKSHGNLTKSLGLELFLDSNEVISA